MLVKSIVSIVLNAVAKELNYIKAFHHSCMILLSELLCAFVYYCIIVYLRGHP